MNASNAQAIKCKQNHKAICHSRCHPSEQYFILHETTTNEKYPLSAKVPAGKLFLESKRVSTLRNELLNAGYVNKQVGSF